MPRRVIADSGPLVSLFDRDDEYHGRAKDFLRRFQGRLLSNMAVVTEVMYLLDFRLEAQLGFLRWARRGALTLIDATGEDMDRTIELMEAYRSLPADYAGASLVAMAERLQISEVATVDRDLSIYRLKGKRAFKNVFLPALILPLRSGGQTHLRIQRLLPPRSPSPCLPPLRRCPCPGWIAGRTFPHLRKPLTPLRRSSSLEARC
jgi:predicted nucleic acid-binding protein